MAELLKKQEELTRLKKLDALKAQQIVPVKEIKVLVVDVPKPKEQGVTKGEYLYKIARSLYNDPEKWAEIYALNKDTVKDPNVIYPGQKILLPSGK